jgi:hypothetical protein
VFGVKDSLVVDYTKVDKETAQEYGVEEGLSVLTHNFVLVSSQEASELQDERSRKALRALGRKVKLLGGLPVPDLD